MADRSVQECWERNPYVGPRPFRRGEAFHGRERDAGRLRDMLVSCRIVLLHAPSGAGKTSLIQAAVIPHFEDRGYTICARRDPGFFSALRVNEPLPDFPVRNRYVYSLVLGLLGHLDLKPAALADTSLSDALAMLADGSDPPRRQLLVIDQLEEALTIDPADLDGQQELFQQVGDALEHDRRWALLSMREDFMGGLDPFLKLIPGRLRSTYRLDFLDRESAVRAVTMPAAGRGVTVDGDAAEQLVDDLGQVTKDPAESAKLRYVEPVLLQVVCHGLWRKLCKAERWNRKTIGVPDLDHYGHVDECLRRYYAEVVREASGNDVETEHALREWIDRKLITEDGLRSQTRTDPQIPDPSAALEVLLDGYLIRRDARAAWWELYHDRLCLPVRRNNASWRRTTIESWRRDAVKWDRSHEDPSYLLSGDAYRRAKRSLAELGDRAMDYERRFIAACESRQAEASTFDRIESQVNPLAILLLVSVAANVFLLVLLFWR